MQYMLDTNICIFLIRKKSINTLQRIRQHNAADLTISSISVAELEYGCDRSAAPDKNRLALIEFLSPFTILPFDGKAARAYGEIRTDLEKKGTPIGGMDLMIAAHAQSQNMTIVTNNTREFNRVADLPVEDGSQS